MWHKPIDCKEPTRRRRYLFIEFCSHHALRALREGERPYSQELFEGAMSIENPLNSYDWYLAPEKQISQASPAI